MSNPLTGSVSGHEIPAQFASALEALSVEDQLAPDTRAAVRIGHIGNAPRCQRHGQYRGRSYNRGLTKVCRLTHVGHHLNCFCDLVVIHLRLKVVSTIAVCRKAVFIHLRGFTSCCVFSFGTSIVVAIWNFLYCFIRKSSTSINDCNSKAKRLIRNFTCGF